MEAKTQQPLSMIQRFENLERAALEHDQAIGALASTVLNYHNKIKTLESIITNLEEVIDSMKTVLETKNVITTTDLSETIVKNRTDALKSGVNEQISKGNIEAVTEILSEDYIVGFKVENKVEYGVASVKEFKDESVRNQLIGKKTGDKINDLEVLEVYKVVEKKETSNAQQENVNEKVEV